MVDYEQATLQPVALASELLDEPPAGATIAGTMAGRAFQRQEVVSAETEAGWRVWAPLVERAERLGVLELGFTAVDDESSASARTWAASSATCCTQPAATPTWWSSTAAGAT